MKPLSRLRDILSGALDRTAALWPEVELGASWVRGASAILANPDALPAGLVSERYFDWVEQLQICAANRSTALREAAAHFVRVTYSYGPDLFHCYSIPGVPRTNNALEQAFGSLRYHERRASGRKVASPSLVLSGCVRMASAAYTRTHDVTQAMLASVPHDRWCSVRAELEHRRHARCLRYRFRKDPAAYLAELEASCDKLNLPS